MLRIKSIAWIVALAAAFLITTDSEAQKGKGGGGGGGRGGPPAGAGRSIGRPGGISGGMQGARITQPARSMPSQARGLPGGNLNMARTSPNMGNFANTRPSFNMQGKGNAGSPGKGGQNFAMPKGGQNFAAPGKGGQGGLMPRNFASQNNLPRNQNWGGTRFGNYGQGNYGYGNNRGYYNNNRYYNNHNGFAHNFLFFAPGLFGFWPWNAVFPFYNYYNSGYGYYDYPISPYLDYGYGYNTPITPWQQGYYPEAGPMPQAGSTAAQIDVLLPEANAQVWFNGSPTTSQGTTRYFDSPPIQSGGNYSYTIKAAWTQNGQPASMEQVVSVTTGSQLVIDFTKSPPLVTKVR